MVLLSRPHRGQPPILNPVLNEDAGSAWPGMGKAGPGGLREERCREAPEPEPAAAIAEPAAAPAEPEAVHEAPGAAVAF